MRWAWAAFDSSLWRRASYINHCMVAAHWESIADQAEQTGLSSSHQGTGNLLLGSQKDRQAHGEGPQIDLQFKLSFSGRRLWIWFDRQEAQKKSQWSCFRLSHSLVLLLLHLAILCIIIIICPSDMRFSVNLWPLKTSALLTREIMSLSLLGLTGGHGIKHPSTHTRGL